jgi:hypothetical protein
MIAARDRADSEENRAGRAILASFAQHFIAYSCNIPLLRDEIAGCVPLRDVPRTSISYPRIYDDEYITERIFPLAAYGRE